MPKVTWFWLRALPRRGELVDVYVSAFKSPCDAANDWGFVPRYSFVMLDFGHLLCELRRIVRAGARVRRLYIGGHGSPGSMDFGTRGQMLTSAFVWCQGGAFGLLARYLARPASVILAACNVAGDVNSADPWSLRHGKPTGVLAQTLSLAMPGVHAVAGLSRQSGGTSKMVGATAVFLDGRLLGLGWSHPRGQGFLPEFQRPTLVAQSG